MNATTKEIKINSSSLVSLKAELLRKEQEFHQDRLKSKSAKPKHIKTKLKDGVGSENPGVTERAAKDMEEKIEEANVIKNSRDILEKKAKLYDEMTKGLAPADEENEQFLVDFTQKHSNQIRENNSQTTSGTSISRETINERDLQQEDWEKISAREASTPTGPIHYANVQHKEIRTHGVGFFQFSEDNKERQEQFDLLNQLRSQTEDQKARKERLKEKRQNVMQQRLAKMRQRRGLPEPEPEQTQTEKEPEVPEVVPLTRDDSWRQVAPLTREWDKGKRTDQNKSYQEKRRDERLPEFAPPAEFQQWSAGGPQHSVTTDQAPATSLPKTATTKRKTSTKPKMNSDDIENALKALRSESNNQPSAPRPNPDNMIPTSMQDVPRQGNESAQQPPASSTGLNMDIGEIPLPPSGPPQAPSPISSINDTREEQSSTLEPEIGPFPAGWPPLPPVPYTTPAVPPPLPPVPYTAPVLPPPLPPVPYTAPVAPPPLPPVPYSAPLVPPPIPHPVTYPPDQPLLPVIDLSRPPPPLTSHGVYSDVTTNYSISHGAKDYQTYQTDNTHGSLPIDTGSSGVTTAPDESVPTKDPAVATLLGCPAESVVENGSNNSGVFRKRHLAPQPAHYSSAPSKVQVPKVPYERINLHQVPLTLPAPPTEGHVTKYRAQDAGNLPGAGKDPSKRPRVNRDVMHNWNRQYDYKDPS